MTNDLIGATIYVTKTLDERYGKVQPNQETAFKVTEGSQFRFYWRGKVSGIANNDKYVVVQLESVLDSFSLKEEHPTDKTIWVLESDVRFYLGIACSEYDSCQIPEQPNSVCYNCGLLRKDH